MLPLPCLFVRAMFAGASGSAARLPDLVLFGNIGLPFPKPKLWERPQHAVLRPDNSRVVNASAAGAMQGLSEQPRCVL